MPSDDLILNVRQIAGYPSGVSTQSGDAVVLQRGGLGGPYLSLDAATFVGTACVSGGPLGVGYAAPSNADEAQIFTYGLTVPVGGRLMWNAYLATGASQETPVVPGDQATLWYEAFTGWQFLANTTGSSNAADWVTALTISPDGYMTVGNQIILARDPLLAMEAATANYVTKQIVGVSTTMMSLYNCATVWSVNRRTGNVILGIDDIMGAGGAPIWSPAFQGQPTAPMPVPASNDGSIATTAWVQQILSSSLAQSAVTSFNGRVGAITLTVADITGAGGAPIASPALTGTPTAPTPASLDDSNTLATTAFVQNALATFNLSSYAPINSPNFTGSPTAPTVATGASDGRIATTAFVHNAVVAATTGVSSFNTRTGAVTLTTADITGAGGAVLAGPVFTGVPQAPTAALATNTNQIATCAFVMAELAGGGVVTTFNSRSGAVTLQLTDITGAGGAPTASPSLTGTPLAPTATAGTSTTQIATTQFVGNAIAAIGTVVQSFNGRSGAVTLQANDISAAGGAVLASPNFSGVPTAPTAVAGTNTGQLATTAFVAAAVAAGTGVSSFNGRSGSVTLNGPDITSAGGALLASPTFTGTPSGPTAAVATNSTQLATCAFVQAALTAGAVTSFNTRTGAVTLSSADITSAGGALLAGPTFTGTPSAPTAALNTNTTQIATTAFVQSALSSIAAGVVSFNGRTGAVTLIANDISSAGGAVLASPAFTGAPTAPTPASTDNSTTLATTAYVQAVIAKPGTAAPLMNGTAAVGTSLLYSRQDHVHPTDTTLMPKAGGIFTGAVTVASGVATAINGPLTYGYSYPGLSGLMGASGPNGMYIYYNSTTGYYAIYQNNTLSDSLPYGYTGGNFFGLTRMGISTTTLQGFCYNNNGNNAYFALTSASDRKFKTKIKAAAKKALDAVKALKVHEFDLTQNDVTQHWEWGLIADEVEKVVPIAFVPADPDMPDSFQTLRDLPLVTMLVKAVQELASKVDALEARLAR